MQPFLQNFLPQHALSRLAGFLANHETPWLKNYLIRYFVNRYPVKLSEAIVEDPFAYPTYNAFFTRALKPELRPISQGLHDFVSPADGNICQFSNFEAGTLFQAKKHNYSVLELIGNDEKVAKHFESGHSLTIYLAPQDYHRVHIPMEGDLEQMIYIPGKLFSVSEKTAECIPNLFARNERVVAIFNTSIGKMAVVLIGAMIVGSIETVWSGTVVPRQTENIERWYYQNPIHFKRGEEIGRFKLGSTVVVLTEKNTLEWIPGLEKTAHVQFGQKLADYKPSKL